MAAGGSVNRLLRELGFSENPFGLREADREQQARLASYFFQHSRFREVLGEVEHPESAVLFAQRGAGKTTFRQEIAYLCREQRAPVAGVLDVAYIEFSRPVQQARAHGTDVDIFIHVDEILRCAVARLLETLDEVRVPVFLALAPGDLATLAAFIRKYSSLLNPDDQGKAAQDLLRRIALASEIALSPDLAQGLLADPQRAIAALPATLQPVAQFLSRLAAQPARPLDSSSYIALLREFLDLLVMLEYKAMYVLVDRLDETSLLQNVPAAARFIQPLLTDLDLLEQPNLAFKMFLPQHLNDYILGKVDLRPKRVLVRHLAWTEDDLLQLLARRLQAFSRYRSMAVFCEPDLAGRMVPGRREVRYVDLALVQAAQRLPRDLILRCRKLFEIFEARNGQGQITEADLQAAITAALGEDNPPALSDLLAAPPATPPPAPAPPPATAPPPGAAETVPAAGLFVDQYQRVWRNGALLGRDLPPTELKVLRYLCAHRYELCAKEEMLETLWENAYDIQFLNTAISRLRALVEYDPKQPRFILTVARQGLRLEDGMPP